MKKILITNMSAIAISVSAFFSSGVMAAEQPIEPIVSNAPSISSPAPATAAPAPLTATKPLESKVSVEPQKEVVVENTDSKKVSVEGSKKEEKKELTYQVSKSTLYNQLAYDFHKRGYKTVWGLSFDPSFTPKKYDSIEDEMLAASNRLNQVWNGNYDDGNKVLALKCPLKKEVHFVFSAYAASVVDSNGVSCDLITPLSKDGSNGSADGSVQANPNNSAGNNYYETGNVLAGPMIVSSQNQ